MPSPRALLGVAPALVVAVGSFALARHQDRQTAADDAADRPVTERVAFPTPADEARLHRVALKQETADDLVDGRLTLAEAVERFETYSAGPEALANLRGSVDGRSDRERAVNQLLSFVRVRTSQDPARFRAAIDRIEAEARAFIGETPST